LGGTTVHTQQGNFLSGHRHGSRRGSAIKRVVENEDSILVSREDKEEGTTFQGKKGWRYFLRTEKA